MIHAPIFHYSGSSIALWSFGLVTSLLSAVLILALDPSSLVTFGTVGMLFATPVAVIINTVMARRDASKAAALAIKVAEQAAEAARLLSDRQDSSANKAAEAARLLLQSNKDVAETARVQGDKLDEIHVLVNSNLTASMESELVAHKAALALMKEMVDIKESSGKKPSRDLLSGIAVSEKKVSELSAKLSDRLKQSKTH
jgi:hypothetical protein